MSKLRQLAGGKHGPAAEEKKEQQDPPPSSPGNVSCDTRVLMCDCDFVSDTPGVVEESSGRVYAGEDVGVGIIHDCSCIVILVRVCVVIMALCSLSLSPPPPPPPLSFPSGLDGTPPFLPLTQETYKSHSAPVTHCKFSPNAKNVATADTDGVLKYVQVYSCVCCIAITCSLKSIGCLLMLYLLATVAV